METQGISDAVARIEYGYPDTWAMATKFSDRLDYQASERPPEATAKPAWVVYLKGVSFALPLLLSCLAMLFMGFSIWGGAIDHELAAAVGIGTIASFVFCGGFVQAMARRGMFYSSTKQFRMCAGSTWQWFHRSAVALAALTAAATAIAAWVGWLPGVVMGVAASFALLLGLFWLATGILYMLERNLLVTGSVLVGIAVVVILHTGLGAGLIGSQLVGVAAASGFALLVSRRLLNRMSASDEGRVQERSLLRELYLLWPYFLYGCLYYVFLFIDRLLAWTAHTNSAGLPIQFRGDYETALAIGLLAFVLLVGWVHYAVVRYYDHLTSSRRDFAVDETEKFNSHQISYYGRMSGHFIVVSAAIIVAVYAAASLTGFVADLPVRHVAVWSLAGFPFLVYGLWNVSLLFALSQPLKAVAAIGWACLTNACVGYLFSRLGTYQDAITGFTVGSIVFAVLTGFHMVRTIRRLDYHQYASTL